MGKEWLSTEIAENGRRRTNIGGQRTEGGATEDLILTTDQEGKESSFIRVIRGQIRDATPELTQGRKDTTDRGKKSGV